MIKIPVLTENVIVRLSGGADSALLLWMICNEWTQAKKPLTVWPITVVHGVRNWQNYHAQQVYDWVQDQWKYDVRFAPLQSVLCEDPAGKPNNKNANNYVDYQENLIDSTVEQIGEMTQVFNGVTANPPEEIGQLHWGSSEVFGENVWECREKHRDWDMRGPRPEVDDDEKRNIIHCCPFVRHHKGHIADLYRQYDLNELLSLTRSCEGWNYMTNGFTEACGECWWCMERDWAFNEYSR
jgi:hypothetical protein